MKEKTNFRFAFQVIGIKTRWTASLAAVLLICLCILSFGCAPVTNVSGPGDPNADVILDELIIEGKTIKAPLSETQGLLPSNGFWFDASDDKTLIYGWNEVVSRQRDNGVSSCNHPTVSPGCRECRLCARTCTDFSPVLPSLSTSSPIASLKKASGNGQYVTLHDFFSLPQGCQSDPPHTFTPVQAEDASIYMLSHEDFVAPDGKAFQKSVFFETHVVSSAQDLRKDMESYRDTTDPNTVRFKFTVPEFNGKLNENFSTSLRITRVRLLLGTRDPKTNVVMYREDSEALKKARPSRVLFLPNFAGGDINGAQGESTNRCYLDPLADDGGFDLTNCRSNPPNSQAPGLMRLHNVTPTYVNGFNQDTLTWVVEYKTSDGLPPAEAFAANEFPAIVWTIQ